MKLIPLGYAEEVPRGRTRDEAARQRILDAAFALVGAGGSASINDIVERAGVAKQTVYRWWPSRNAVVLDALVDGTMRETPFPDTGDLRADFRAHLRGVVRLFNSPTGTVVRNLVADSQTDERLADDFRERFWAPRRALSLVRIERGVELGQIRSDLDIELVLDAIYGPLWLRLLIGHRRLRPSDADRIVDAIWPGIATA